MSGEVKKSATSATGGRKRTPKTTVSKPKAEVLHPIDGMLDEVEGTPQGMAAKAFAKIMNKISGNASESQKAAIDSINATVEEMGKLHEGMSPAEKLKLAEQMAEAGKGAERVNESNNSTWRKLGEYAVVGCVVIAGGALMIVTKGRALKFIPKG
ncbi:hypothetical protein N6H05_19420 [Sphingobium sp. WTD-1]|uniref:hypothetical protein n=1 Tax=Sphingobium sp. WTD-1 TaxID=2979467 RepID=UPI0024DE7001|nr:hypothetical protein [Sphingobium sp. WTD-1]WIA55180.1 hypothetical protein N6H05_19420 [Sphingobium sp. WTD-1]